MENNLEEKLGAILSDPNMMQKIQAIAQSLGQTQQPQATAKTPSQDSSSAKAPDFDFSALQQLGTLAGQTGIDQNQQTLLSALSPYLSRSRVQKLEKAMQAAKMARLASSFLNNGGLQLLNGR